MVGAEDAFAVCDDCFEQGDGVAGAARVPVGGGEGLLAALLILFPTGEPPSNRWRPVLWTAGLATLLSIVAAVSAWPARGISMVLAEAEDPAVGVFYVFSAAGFFALLAGVVAGVASLVVRFRQANPDQRPQVKLLLFAVVAAIGGMAIVFVMLVLFTVESKVVADFILGIPIALIPIAMGVAILRFRVYDIDRVISRTVAYLLLTVVVTGVYVSVVLGAGQLLGDASTRTPSWAVAAATLAAAAIVQPARHRIQGPSTAASIAASTMRPRPSKRSARSCVTNSNRKLHERTVR